MEEVSKRAKELLKRFDNLKEIRSRFEPLWRECEWAVSSVVQKWDDEKPNDPYSIPKRETSRPTNFLNTCCTGIAGYAVSANIKWFKLSLESKEMNEADGVPQWLEQCEKVIRRTFERCQFYKKSLHWLELGGIYGHAAMLIEEISNADAPIRYHVPEAQEVYFDNNDIGEIEVVYRYYWTDVENIVNRYGRKAMHKNLLEQYDKHQEKPENRDALDIKILHAVELRRAGKPEYGETVANKKWASVIVDVANKHIIKESGYDEFPYAIFYWQHTGKPYGISPAIMGMSDIKMYQSAYSALLIAMQQSVNPTKFVPDEAKKHWNFDPGAINTVRSMEQAPQTLDVGANFPMTVQILDRFEQSVKDWFNVDFFIMLRQQQGLGQMTATAINAMQGEQAALLSALVSNLFDGLSKTVERTFNILAKKRMLPPMPFALQVMGGKLRCDFQGVLAQAQKAAYEYTGLTDVMSIAAGFNEFGKVNPQWSKAVNWLKPDVMFKKTLESRGVSTEVLRTEEEYNKFMAGIDEQEERLAAQQAQAMTNQAAMQNFKSLNQKVTHNSPAAQLFPPS
jgi:hypothetical protein